MSYGTLTYKQKAQLTSTQHEINKVYQVELDLHSPYPKIKFSNKQIKPVKELDKIQASSNIPPKELRIRYELRQPLRSELVEFLSHNLDIFTCGYKDMERIKLKIACHKFYINPLV